MTIYNKNQFKLLVIFYKSTLALSITCPAMLAVLNLFNIPAMLLVFGICFMSAGTVISLLYKEISKKQEYYFYYNKGISKGWLMLTCAVCNFIFGLLLILIS